MVLAVVASNEGKARWITATMVETGEEREQGRKAVKEGYGVGKVAATPDDEKRRRSTAGEEIRGKRLRRKSSRKRRPRRWRSLMRSTKPRRSTANDPTTMEVEKRRQQGAEVTGTEIGEEKAGGGAGGKKTEGDGEEEEGRETAAMVVGERKPSWVVGVEMEKEGSWRRDLVHWWRRTEKRGRRGGGRRLLRFRRRGKHRLSRQRGRNDERGRRKRPRSTTAVIGEDEAVVDDRMWRGGREKERERAGVVAWSSAKREERPTAARRR